MQDNDVPAQEVIRANDSFYRAFESLEIETMAEVWVQDDTVKCVHPGWPVKLGWEAVRDSWSVIFQNTEYMEFTITDINALVTGDFGWVTCTESLRSVAGGQQNMGVVQTTNLFLRRGEAWLMVHHHGSPIYTA